MDELKKCPFCSGKPSNHLIPEEGHYYGCVHTILMQHELWNTRPLEDALRAELSAAQAQAENWKDGWERMTMQYNKCALEYQDLENQCGALQAQAEAMKKRLESYQNSIDIAIGQNGILQAQLDMAIEAIDLLSIQTKNTCFMLDGAGEFISYMKFARKTKARIAALEEGEK